MNDLGVLGGNGLGKKSVAFGTVISHLIPPHRNGKTRLMKLVYTAAGTAHTITVFQELGRTTLSADAAASQAVINLTAQPTSGNNVAANDYLVIEQDSGVCILVLVSSVSSLAITLSASLSTAISAGATVWHMGITTDTVPLTGNAHPAFNGIASATTTYSNDVVGIAASPLTNSPLVVQSNNATATGTIEQVDYMHTKK